MPPEDDAQPATNKLNAANPRENAMVDRLLPEPYYDAPRQTFRVRFVN
jgi:hypothetical protein